MKVKQVKDMLNGHPDDQEVILLDEARMGHDDAVLGFTIKKGLGDGENIYDIRLVGKDLDEEEKATFTVPCCVISFWK